MKFLKVFMFIPSERTCREKYDSKSPPTHTLPRPLPGAAAALTSKCLVKLSLIRLAYLKQKPLGLNHPVGTTL